MSPPPLSRSRDLRRLVDDGYDVAIVSGHLVVRDVPYIDATRAIRRGTLVSRLDLAGDVTVAPRDHVVWFAGALPCDDLGRPLVQMVHSNGHPRDLGGGLVVDHMLCSRPLGREFADYHEKMVTFVQQLAGYATMIDPTASACAGRVMAAEEGQGSFMYVDTATSRSGIGELSDRIEGQSIGIVGLGGTGSYVLDMVAKCPVRSIHLFDDDRFLQHNAFRSPGAASAAELALKPSKVGRMEQLYSRLHRGVIGHRVKLTPNRFAMLDGLDFVFVCIDRVEVKPALIAHLEDGGIGFIDVGMGLHHAEAGLTGTLRVTTSTPLMRAHVRDRHRIPLSEGEGADAYATNIQVVELNALNAALAVVRWKRLFGFYADFGGEHFSVYSVDGNAIVNDEIIE